VAHHFVPNSIRESSISSESISQSKIVKNFGLSASTEQNIVKRFRESGETSVLKGQGQKPLLEELGALRQHCMRNRHATMINTAT